MLFYVPFLHAFLPTIPRRAGWAVMGGWEAQIKLLYHLNILWIYILDLCICLISVPACRLSSFSLFFWAGIRLILSLSFPIAVDFSRRYKRCCFPFWAVTPFAATPFPPPVTPGLLRTAPFFQRKRSPSWGESKFQQAEDDFLEKLPGRRATKMNFLPCCYTTPSVPPLNAIRTRC